MDPMHIFKDVCKFAIEYLVGNKDTAKERDDLKLSNTKQLLWDRYENEKGKMVYPKALYIIHRSKDRSLFFKRMSSIRAPSHFGAVLANAFTKKKDRFFGLKSHDFYNTLHYHLPLAIWGLVSKGVEESIFRLSRFARYVCMREISPTMMENLEKEAAIVVVLLRMQFPSSFFDGQGHLLVHLPSELRIARHVQTRWMFPVEHYVKVLKNYVRQRARPEGSIVQGYLLQEKIHILQEKFGGFESQNLQAWNFL
jgi:hypothetical protein